MFGAVHRGVARIDGQTDREMGGGKSKLLDPLCERVPTTIRTYAEPFAGGAALFFALADDPSHTFERAVIADQNEDLIACYRAVKGDVEAVIAALSGYTHSEEMFYRVRDQDPRGMTDIERGARLIYLNRTCFNGLWRVNRSGKFNVPFGRYTNPRIVDADGLRAASKALARAEVMAVDFAEVTRTLAPGDFAYFDPPYVPLSKSASFTAYAQRGSARPTRSAWPEHRPAQGDRSGGDALQRRHTGHPRDVPRLRRASRHVPSLESTRALGRGPVGRLIVTNWGPPGIAGRRHAAGRTRGAGGTRQSTIVTGTKLPSPSTRMARYGSGSSPRSRTSAAPSRMYTVTSATTAPSWA